MVALAVNYYFYILYFILKSECVAHKRYKISRARNWVI